MQPASTATAASSGQRRTANLTPADSDPGSDARADPADGRTDHADADSDADPDHSDHSPAADPDPGSWGGHADSGTYADSRHADSDARHADSGRADADSDGPWNSRHSCTDSYAGHYARCGRADSWSWWRASESASDAYTDTHPVEAVRRSVHGSLFRGRIDGGRRGPALVEGMVVSQ